MNWSTLVKVARFQLADWSSYTALPWFVLAVNFAFWGALLGSFGGHSVEIPAVAAIYAYFLIAGALSIFRSLPFALALGVSRRAYYAGTALLAVGLSAVYGLALALLQVIEGATGGWGIGLHFFRLTYILSGPWYLTWLTSFVGLVLAFAYGMWNGVVYRRWSLIGLLIFAGAQAAAAIALVIAVGDDHAWPSFGRFFTGIGAAGLTGLLAALAVVLLAGGYSTMRRVTV